MSSAARKEDPAAAIGPSLPYAPGDFVVYAGHGVGRVVNFETRKVSGVDLCVVVVNFEAEGMILRVASHKAGSAGLRAISSRSRMAEVLTHLAGPPVEVKGIWSRRLVEHTAKINSGDPLAVAEVVRDLYRPANGKARSPGQQMLYEKALSRLVEELAAVDMTDTHAATVKLEALLNVA